MKRYTVILALLSVLGILPGLAQDTPAPAPSHKALSCLFGTLNRPTNTATYKNTCDFDIIMVIATENPVNNLTVTFHGPTIYDYVVRNGGFALLACRAPYVPTGWDFDEDHAVQLSWHPDDSKTDFVCMEPQQ